MQGQLQDSYQTQLVELSRRQEGELVKTEDQMNVLTDDIGQLTHFKNTYRQNEEILDGEKNRCRGLQLELQRVRDEAARDMTALQKRIEENFERQINEY